VSVVAKPGEPINPVPLTDLRFATLMSGGAVTKRGGFPPNSEWWKVFNDEAKYWQWVGLGKPDAWEGWHPDWRV
jgi:hypothetical protein